MNNFGKVIENASQKDYTTYKLKGKIKKVVYPSDTFKLKELLKYLKDNNLKYKVLGNGSNVIFLGDYDGIVIKLDKLDNLQIKNDIIEVEAGYNLMKLALKCAGLSLSGLEFSSGIPGTIGGAIYMNAGAYGSDMSSVVTEVLVLDENLNFKTLTKEELEFSYRHSLLKDKNYICLKATLKLTKGIKEDILNLINERKLKRLSSQPLEFPSAGSVFRNPEGTFSGKLIENAGLKGMKIGDAMISEKHANFIVNTGNASGEDIVKLINLVKDKVKNKYAKELLLEQEIIKR